MKFQIHCDCNSLFLIDFERLIDKEKIQCSNCDKVYSNETLDKLKTVSKTLQSCKCDTSGGDNITVKITGNLITG